MEDGTNGSVHHTLYNMMNIVDTVCPNDYAIALRFSRDLDIGNRNYGVEWMKECVAQVLSEDCPSTRDTSVQIFDTYLLLNYERDPRVLRDTDFLSYSAAASVILAAKLHDTNSKLSMNKFSNFQSDRLVIFERHILASMGGKFSPMTTPSTFAHYLVDIVPEIPRSTRDSLLHHAFVLIAEFWEESEYVLYAPSTIAISALMISFSQLKVPCNDWLHAIPMYFFANDENPFFGCCGNDDNNNNNHTSATLVQQTPPVLPRGTAVNARALFLDQDECINAFQRMPHLRRSAAAPCSVSPVSIADGPQQEQQQQHRHGFAAVDDAEFLQF